MKPDSNGNYPDEPLSGNTNDPNDWAYLKHIYTYDQDESVEMIYQFRAVLDEHKQKNGGDSRYIFSIIIKYNYHILLKKILV